MNDFFEQLVEFSGVPADQLRTIKEVRCPIRVPGLKAPVSLWLALHENGKIYNAAGLPLNSHYRSTDDIMCAAVILEFRPMVEAK